MSSPKLSPTCTTQQFYEELLNKYQLSRLGKSESNENNILIVEPEDNELYKQLFEENKLNLIQKLILLKKKLKSEEDKETKIKETTEYLRKDTLDSKILTHLNNILKQINYKLNELNRDIQEIDSHIKFNEGQGRFSPIIQPKKDSFDSFSDKEDEKDNNDGEKNSNASMMNLLKPDENSISSLELVSSPNTRTSALEKQLNIEQKVKDGAQNMLNMYSKSKNKKLIKEAQNMLDYSNAKIQFIKMMIEKANDEENNRIKRSNSDTLNNLNNTQNLNNLNLVQIQNQIKDDFKNTFIKTPSKSSSCVESNSENKKSDLALDYILSCEKIFDLRIQELRARLKLELTIIDGLKNVINTLQSKSGSKIEKKTVLEAKQNLNEALQKLDLIRISLRTILNSLDETNPNYELIKNDLINLKYVNSISNTDTFHYLPVSNNLNAQVDLKEIVNQTPSFLPKTAPVTGKLEIKLIGICNLLENLEHFGEIELENQKGSNSYKINEVNSSKVKAVLKLDNFKVGETTWQKLGEKCFQVLGFLQIELDRNRELEIQFFYNDSRSFCAFKHLYLEEFVNSTLKPNEKGIFTFNLEPQGELFVEIKLLNPMIARNVRLQRRKLLRFKSETFLRPNQMNINVATWGRLIKKDIFPSAKSFSNLAKEENDENLNKSSLSISSTSSSDSTSSSMCNYRFDQNYKILNDKLNFIKDLNEQKKLEKDYSEIVSLSSDEEEIELIYQNNEVTIEEQEEQVNEDQANLQKIRKSQTENLRPKNTMKRINKLNLKLKIEPVEVQDSLDIDDNQLIKKPVVTVDENEDENNCKKIKNLNIYRDLIREKKQQSEQDECENELVINDEKSDKSNKWDTQELKLTDFTFVCTLGKGYFGKVLLSKYKNNDNYYAVKVLKKIDILSRYEVDSLLSEKYVFMLAKKNKHPFLIELLACIQTDQHVCFIMEYAAGGDLMMHINQCIFDEKRASFYAGCILLCLEFLHNNKIIYRDLKLDNILLDQKGYVKLVDYGLCKLNIGHNDHTDTFCGTPEFLAPEILTQNSYTKAVDWWAFGILIFEMLVGCPPFPGDDDEEIFDSIVHDEVVFPKYLSFESTVLMRRLLRKDPQKRLGSSVRDADDVKKHSFFKWINFEKLYNKIIEPPFVPSVVFNGDVSNFDYEFTCKDAKLSFSKIAKKLTDKDQNLFSKFDYISEDWIKNNQANPEDDQIYISNEQRT